MKRTFSIPDSKMARLIDLSISVVPSIEEGTSTHESEWIVTLYASTAKADGSIFCMTSKEAIPYLEHPIVLADAVSKVLTDFILEMGKLID